LVDFHLPSELLNQGLQLALLSNIVEDVHEDESRSYQELCWEVEEVAQSRALKLLLLGMHGWWLLLLLHRVCYYY